MDAEQFKEILNVHIEKAIRIACAMEGLSKENYSYTSFDDEEAEVVFTYPTYPTYCSGCEDETKTVFIKIEDLFQDIDKLVKQKEEERAEITKQKEEKYKLKKQQEIIAKEKRDRELYEKLKTKFEG